MNKPKSNYKSHIEKADNTFNEDTLKAIFEAKRISSDPNVKSYSSSKELFEALKKEGI